jgi:cytochrome c-type biogenesis protein CcmF
MANYLEEDVYIVLTGVEMDRGAVRAVNLRVYINPLINWVWLGFVFVALGTAVCLLPQRWIDRMTGGPPPDRLGRLGQNAALLLVLGGISFGAVHGARAQAPPGQEHEDTRFGGQGGHSVAEGAAHLNRPDGAVAEKAMADLVCMCGGCSRETVLDCKCGFAAEERGRVLAILATYDLDDPAQANRAYDAVMASFVGRFGEAVRIVPKDTGFNRLGWGIPYLALGGGLVLLFTVGRRWVRRGKMQAAAASAAPAAPGDRADAQAYDDLLDDELRDTD